MKGDDSIEIKIIGSNCSNGIRLKKIINRVSREVNVNIFINEINGISDKKKHNISMIPAIVFDDKIISQSKVISDREIKKLILTT